MSSDESRKKPLSTMEEESDPPARTREEVARLIGSKPGRSPDTGAGEEVLRDAGPLRLDKSGALIGRPKLQPRRAHRRPGEEAVSASEALAETAERASGPRKAALPSRLSSLRPEGYAPPVREEAKASPGEGGGAPATVEEIDIPAGTFPYGDTRRPLDLETFRIDKYPVTNGQYEDFVRATGHRPPLYWIDGHLVPALRDHPVVGVDYYDALAFARWQGKDLPFEDEWERSARGTDGRAYPWGDDQELSGANTARVGLKMTVPVDLHRANVSPDGCRDLVGNAWEITHSPAPGGGVVVRGGSWYDFALYAKTFFRFASRPDARNGTIGFRCCRRTTERPDATREVPLDQADGEIAARRGPQPPVDRGEWSVERRDLLPDLPRLALHVAEVRAEDLVSPKRGVAVTLYDPPPASREAAGGATPPRPPVETEAATPAPHTEEDVAVAAVAAAAAAPEQARPPAPVESPPMIEAERVHVSAAPPAARAVAGDHTAVQRAAERAVRDHRLAQPVPKRQIERAMPVYMWVLLAAGFLLFGGLLAVLLNQPSEVEEGPGDGLGIDFVGPPALRSAVADLPDIVPEDQFPGIDEGPLVADMKVPEQAARLTDGTWLLVFADPETVEGRDTLRAAHAVHRRVAPSGVRVAIVLPRQRYADADGTLPEAEVLAARLKEDGHNGLWDAIHVLLDPLATDGHTMLHAVHCRPAEVVAAVLMHHGRSESRTSPPTGGFHLETLARIAKGALELVGGGS